MQSPSLQVNWQTVRESTLSSMIHYIYTGELEDGWQDLDIQDVTTAADMYNLPGWREQFTSDMSVILELQNITLWQTRAAEML